MNQLTGVTQAGYARHRGVSRPYINRLYHDGALILNADGTIDAAASDAALAKANNPIRGGKGGGGVQTRSIAAERAGEPDAASMASGSLGDAKRRDAEYVAKLRRIEYERRIGALIEAREVTRAIGEIGPVLDQLDGIPDRATARMRAAQDERAARAILAEEIATCRQGVADFCLALVERLTANPS